jgi:hypothetical protein
MEGNKNEELITVGNALETQALKWQGSKWEDNI